MDLSIEHWEENAMVLSYHKATIFAEDCALCHTHNGPGYEKDGADTCSGCPIAEKAGNPGCLGSPWEQAKDAYLEWGSVRMHPHSHRYMLAGTEFREAAQEMVQFLKDLRTT